MLSFLPPFLRGCIVALIIALNTAFWFLPLMLATFLKLVIPIRAWQAFFGRVSIWIASIWIATNNFSLWLTQATVWDVEGLDELDRRGWYLIASNHQSWADIMILQRILLGRVPFLKFFLKQELIWVPLLGVAWWALDFPFMKRYTREEIARNPELKGKDLETTKKACEKFKHNPIAIFNFLEGTRFTRQKQLGQQSPYKNLLKPRAGGIGFVLSAMGDHISTMINVTIVYCQEEPPGLWEFLCGRVPRIIVRMRVQEIPTQFLGRNYEDDEAFRLAFQEWVRALWEEKDAHIEEIKAVEAARAGRPKRPGLPN